MPAFQLVGLPYEPFARYFSMADADLVKLDARRVVASGSPGFPCRVSLADAEVGEELILLPYVHQPAASPYRASGPIFVRKGAGQRRLEAGEIPDYVSRRVISVRAYDAAHSMTDAAVCEGTDVASALQQLFDDPAVAYIHLHNAKQGCFSCCANRVE
jgi:hypothetical protein